MKHSISLADRACLPSKGLNERRATEHRYSHSEVITIPARDGAGPISGLAHFYTCTETGENRQYGFDAVYGKDIAALQGN